MSERRGEIGRISMQLYNINIVIVETVSQQKLDLYQL
jgi:hypothetical protein